jgi:hypothetical protein
MGPLLDGVCMADTILFWIFFIFGLAASNFSRAAMASVRSCWSSVHHREREKFGIVCSQLAAGFHYQDKFEDEAGFEVLVFLQLLDGHLVLLGGFGELCGR